MSKTSGKHNPDHVLIGFMDSPEFKALAEMVAECETRNGIADIFRAYVADRAASYGIVVDGVIQDKWRARISSRAKRIREAKKARQDRESKTKNGGMI